ncbi:hypothetical protein D6D17_04066 [Aureobasidium pullulans]|nr:hypothetical protein D6D17_04066 [Aureobasidium pullulans]
MAMDDAVDGGCYSGTSSRMPTTANTAFRQKTPPKFDCLAKRKQTTQRARSTWYAFKHVMRLDPESPHEHQQNVLLSRIITNVEKLNEAVMMLNKSLQVSASLYSTTYEACADL